MNFKRKDREDGFGGEQKEELCGKGREGISRDGEIFKGTLS